LADFAKLVELFDTHTTSRSLANHQLRRSKSANSGHSRGNGF
jgi:hypothetical protein